MEKTGAMSVYVGKGESIAVGEDRVVLRTNETLQVHRLDGTLAHEAIWVADDGGWNMQLVRLPVIVVVLVIATFVIGLLGLWTRRARLR